MSCIHESLIQKHIDGEATPQEEAMIKDHLSECKGCREKVSQKRNLSLYLKKAINLLNENEVSPPELLQLTKDKKRNPGLKRLIYSVSAACLLVLIFFIYQSQKPTEDVPISTSYNLESEFDANSPITEQDMVIEIIDSKGKRSTY